MSRDGPNGGRAGRPASQGGLHAEQTDYRCRHWNSRDLAEYGSSTSQICANGPPSRWQIVRASADSLACIHERRLVTLTFASWNPLRSWLRQLDSLRGTDP